MASFIAPNRAWVRVSVAKVRCVVTILLMSVPRLAASDAELASERHRKAAQRLTCLTEREQEVARAVAIVVHDAGQALS